MNRFLSEENLAIHRDYLRVKRLKYSIIEGSLPALSGAKIQDVYRMKISDRDRRDALDLLAQISLHDVFFSSFSESQFPRSDRVRSEYGSEANFLNLLYRHALNLPYGFVLVYLVSGRIKVLSTSDFVSALRYETPILAIDACEHSYFMDYGFDKERYLLSLLPYLDIAKLSAQD